MVSRAELAARALLERFRLSYGGQVELEQLAYALRILVYTSDLKGAEARLVRGASWSHIALSEALNPGLRKQFSIAHELGNYFLHTRPGGRLQCRADALDTGRTEREANAFAAELLMPRRRWLEAARTPTPDLKLVRALADHHQVSLTTAAVRFVRLSSARCAVIFCDGPKVGWSAPSPRLGYRFQKGGALTKASLAWGYLQGHPMPDWPTRVPATAWLRLSGRKREAEVIEHCVPMPAYRAALSMLVLPQDSGL